MAQNVANRQFSPFQAQQNDLEALASDGIELVDMNQQEGETASLVGRNEPQPSKLRRNIFIAFSLVSIVIVLGCIDLFVIIRGKPMLEIDSANLSLDSSANADATLTMQGSIGSNSAFHSVEVGSSSCEMKYSNNGQPDQWVQLGSIEGTTHASHLTFEFKSTEFSSLRHLLYDTTWNRPTGASVRCSIDVTVYMYRFMAVPCSLSMEASLLAPTSEKASWSLSTSGYWAGRTMFSTVSGSTFNRSSIDPRTALNYLQSMHSDHTYNHKDPRAIVQSVMDLFNHTTPKELHLNASMNNPLFTSSASGPPLSSFVIAVPTVTVSATALGDEEGGGRFFFTADAFNLELMKPTLHLQTTLSLQCSDSFSLEEEDTTVLDHCGFPGPSQIWTFYQSLLNNRIHLKMDAISDNFVTHLAGKQHSLSAAIGNSTDADAMLNARLADIRSRSDTADDNSAGALPALYRAAKHHEDTDIHFMGYGVSSHGSCVMLDADHVYQLMGCADQRDGLVKFRMHLLNEEEVLLAAALRNTWATEGTAEVQTGIRLTVSNDYFFQWNSTISESANFASSDFTFYQQQNEKIRSKLLAQWLIGENDAAHFIRLRGHIKDEVFIHDDNFNVDSALRWGLNAFTANLSASSFDFVSQGNYDFGDDMTWHLHFQKAAVLWEKEVKGAGTFHVDSVRLTNGAHPTNTANASMVLNIVRDNDMPVFSIHCMGAYGKILLNRFLTVHHLDVIGDDTKRLLSTSGKGNLDIDGNMGLQLQMFGRENEQLLSMDNLVTWMKPEDTRWDTAGHFGVSSVLHTNGDVDWNMLTNLDYEDNKYRASIRNRKLDGSEMFHVFVHGTFRDRDPYWWFSADNAGLNWEGKAVGGVAGSVDVNQRGSIDLKLSVNDNVNVTQFKTHTALNWSDPALYDSEVHLSMHSRTHFFSIVDWDTDFTVDFAENMYAVRIMDMDAAVKPTFRIDGNGYFLKDKNTMIFRVQQIALYTRFDKVFGFHGSIELHEAASFAIGFAVSDGNNKELIAITNSAAWASQSADWERDGAIELHGVANLFDLIDWDTRVILGYGDSHFHGSIADVSKNDKEVFKVEGYGQYGKSSTYWRWSMDRVSLFVDERKVGSATTGIDYRNADNSWMQFHLNVSDHNDVLNLVTNSSLKWSKPHYATWEDAGRIEVSSVFNAWPNRVYSTDDDTNMPPWQNGTDVIPPCNGTSWFPCGNWTGGMPINNGTIRRGLAMAPTAGFVCDGFTTQLDLSHQGLTQLPDLSACSNIEYLNIAGNKLSTFPVEVFEIGSLQSLNAGYNNFTFIPQELSNAGNLLMLNLRGNRLTSLPAEIHFLTQLTWLDVQDNRLTFLPASIGSLTNMQELYLQNNYLVDLPEEIGQLRQMQGLFAQDNYLESLPNSIGRLTKLKDCYLDGNRLTDLPGSIRYLASLTTLSVNHNAISNLTSAIGDLVQLESLYLNYNQLTYLPGQMRDMFALLELHVDHNMLYGLPWEIGELHNLQLLSASYNQIYYLPETMGNLHELLFMYLDHNQISSIPGQFEYLTKLRRIDISSNNLGNVPWYFFELQDLEYFNYDGKPELICDENSNYLNWAYRNLFSFDLPDFSNCPNVQHLDLRGNNLEYLPFEVSTMRSLTFLDISDNDFTDLPWWINSFPELYHLDISGNHMEHLPAELGDALSLRELYADNNDLVDLPYEIGNLINLQLLDVQYNQLEHLPIEIGRLSNLTFLQVSDNQLMELLPEIGQLRSLVTLYFWTNNIASLPTEIGMLSSLEFLNFNDNNIKTIPASIGNLVHLKQWLLRRNYVEYFPSEIGSLTHLEYWNIERNQVRALPWQIGDLVSLQALACYSNQIGELPASIGNLHQLYRLQAGGNLLTTLPAEFGQLSGLTDLSMYYNRLTVLPNEFSNLHQLQVLDLSSNMFTSLRDEMFYNMEQLQSLLLSYNRLAHLPSSIGRLLNLNYLYASGNQLTQLPAELSLLKDTLYSIYVSSNEFTEFPPALFAFNGLSQIDLSDNHIGFLSSGIAQMTELRYLYLSGNMLSGLPHEFAELSSLLNLDLSWNMFHSFPSVVTHLPLLEYLNLRNNEISYLPPDIQNMQVLENFDLSDNQLYLLPPYIGNLTSLQYLYLRNNHLSELPLEITHLYELRTLDVSRNQLYSIPQEIYDMPGLNIYTWGNPGFPDNYGGYDDDDDDAFINFVGSVAGILYYALRTGWDAHLLLDYGHNQFHAHLVERTLSGKEQVRVTGNGTFTKHTHMINQDVTQSTFFVDKFELHLFDEFVGAVGGKLMAVGDRTNGTNSYDVKAEGRLFDGNWVEQFHGNATGLLNLNAPEGQMCSVGGKVASTLAELYGNVDYSGQKYMVSASAFDEDGHGGEFERSFTLPPFIPNLCPKPKEPCVVNCQPDTVHPSPNPTRTPTAVPSTWRPTVQPSSVAPTATPSTHPSHNPTAAPTVSPTQLPGTPTTDPTTAPTAKPTAAPTTTPTANPSANPTCNPSAAPTVKPTPAPSASPSAKPTPTATDKPTPVPTRGPTVGSTTLMPTASPTFTVTSKPTARPSIRPTAVPTTAAPTLNSNAPLIDTIGTSVSRTTIALDVVFTVPAVYAGTVYCAAFPSSTAVTTNQQIITAPSVKAAGYLADSTGASVTITGRSAVTTYSTYCAVVTINGVSSLNADTLDTMKSVETACCKQVTFTNAPSVIYGSVAEYYTAPANQYVFTYALSAAPGSSVTITPTLTGPDGLSVLPATTTFTSTSGNLGGRFVLSGSATLAGTYTVTLVPSGASAAQFDSTTQVSVNVINSLTAKPAPVLLSAKFANSGGSMVMTFDAATNRAGISATTFHCSEVFTFTGSNDATCSWVNGNTVRAVFAATVPGVAEVLPDVDDQIHLLGAKVKAECAPGVDCSAYEAAQTQFVLALVPDSPVVPNVQLVTAAVVSSCDNVTIDPSNSVGSGGRAWTAVTWTVLRADASAGLVSVPRILGALNSYGLVISSPINLQRTLFSPATYTITLTLTNFLGQTASATAIFSLDANPNLPIVNILGPSVRSMSPSDSLQLYTSTTQASCAEKTSTISYKWTVKENGVVTNKPSVSSVPSKFNLLPYALTAGNVYTIIFEATAKATENTNAITGRATTTVQVVNGAVVIVVVGGYRRQVPVAPGGLTIDASPSYDENIARNLPSGLSFAWTCKLASAAVFGNDCGAVMSGVVLSNKVLSLDATLLDASYLYEFQVIAKASDGRSSVAVVSVQPQLGGSTFTSITSVVDKVNPDNRISLSGLVRAENYGLDCSWSAAVDGRNVPFNALTPKADRFSRVAVRNNFKFELLVPGGTFVPGSTVTFRLLANFAGNSTRFRSYSEIAIKINAPPSGGAAVVTPPSGDALTTDFILSTAGWSDDAEDFPLTYQFQYQTLSSQPPLNLQSRSPSNKVSTSLPAGPDSEENKIVMMCTVFDASLAANTISTTAVVKEVKIDMSAYVTAKLSNFDNVGDVNTVGQLIANVATTMNQVNCSSATADFCTSLNREPCSETPQTCSKCMETYIGVLGDSNAACMSNRRRKLQAMLGDVCTVDGDCLFGKCADGHCVAPPKLCPSDSADECSGHGTCTYSTRSGVKLDHVCSVMDYECHARCECVEGYGGRTCAMTADQLLAQDGLRASLCQAVITVADNSDVSVQLLESLFGFMDAAFDPNEVFTPEGTSACEDAMKFVGDIVLANKALLKEMETSKLDLLLKTTAKFAAPRPGNAPRGSMFMHQLISTLHEGILASMVNGQSSYSYATPYMRTLLSKTKLDGSSDGYAIAPPPTDDENFYGSAGVESFIEVVDSTSTSPFADADGYLNIAVMLWGNNPFPDASTIQSAMLRVENYNLNPARRALATTTESSGRALTDTYDYYIVVQLNEQYQFNRDYTPEEALAAGLNVTFPECRNFDGTTYTECTGCEVSTYTDFNVTFGCTITNERRALSTSSGLVNQFGTVITAPSATVFSAAPTTMPTEAPTAEPTAETAGDSSPYTIGNTALIIGLCVGVPAFLILLGLILRHVMMISNKNKSIAPESAATSIVPA